jgi:hypothetical protein
MSVRVRSLKVYVDLPGLGGQDPALELGLPGMLSDLDSILILSARSADKGISYQGCQAQKNDSRVTGLCIKSGNDH